MRTTKAKRKLSSVAVTETAGGPQMSSMLENVRPMLEPGEEPRFVIQGQTGLNPLLSWITFWLIVANKARIIVVTDRRIAVLSAGQLRMQRNKPKRLLFSAPRSTPLTHSGHAWSKVLIGPEKIWVNRRTYPILDRVNVGLGTVAVTT